MLKMNDLKQFNIPFIGLKEGSHLFEYKIDKKFFDDFNFDDFLDSAIKVELKLVKNSTFLELTFKANGYVNVLCDTSGEPYNQKIDATLPLLVKFGQVYNDNDLDVLILPSEAYQFSVAQFIYEMIVLAVPSKRIHPKVLDGTMESETLKKLRELEIKKEKTVEEADPRWDKLKDLLTEKKT